MKMKHGWRLFVCNACMKVFECAGNDRFSPHGEECGCGGMADPVASRPDEHLRVNKRGELTRIPDRKVLRESLKIW